MNNLSVVSTHVMLNETRGMASIGPFVRITDRDRGEGALCCRKTEAPRALEIEIAISRE